MKKRISTAATLALAFLGIADSSYLLQAKVEGTALMCDLGALSGCNAVAESPYSMVFGIPIAAYGVAFYSALFLVAALELIVFHRRARQVIQVFAAFGLAASAYFTLLQLFVIQAVCIYCIASAAISALIFLCAFFIEPISPKLWRKRSKADFTVNKVPAHARVSLPPQTE